MFKYYIALMSAFLLISDAASAQTFQLGTLSCQLTDTKNRIVMSRQVFDCTLSRAGGADEKYTGELRRAGVDLTLRADGAIVWNVLAATEDAQSRNSIAGTYVGAGAEVAVGVGFGARVLVGGGDEAISLSPVSISVMAGGGATLGVERFTLTKVE